MTINKILSKWQSSGFLDHIYGYFFPPKPRSVIYTNLKVAQLCPTPCDPMDWTVHGIPQARILERVAIPFSRGIFPTQGSNLGLQHCRQILYHWVTEELPLIEDKLLFHRSFIENYKYTFSKLAFETLQGICMKKESWDLFHLLWGRWNLPLIAIRFPEWP